MRIAQEAPTVALPSGERVAAFGMGTWHIGEDMCDHEEEVATIQLGLDLGAGLIDTAEMYGQGASEKLIGEAVAGRRDSAFLVTKILPQNATLRGTPNACERSLRRLRTDHIDLYLLHWRGPVPLAETLEAFGKLKDAGKIRYYGVSNLDVEDMKEAWAEEGGGEIATNEVLYNLAHRGIEWDLQPWMRARKMPVMAYSPFGHSGLLGDEGLIAFARRQGMTEAQTAIAWLLARRDVIALPKTSHRSRLREDFAACAIHLDESQLAELDELFPPPKSPMPLEML